METIVARLKDGLFVGEVDLAVDDLFLRDQRVTHVVHCTYRGKKNEVRSPLTKCFLMRWESKKDAKLFTSRADAISTVQSLAAFMVEAQTNGNAVIVVSHKQRELALVACTLYFMLRFGWTFEKSMKLIRNKRDFRNFRPRKCVRDQIKHYQSSFLRLKLYLSPRDAVIAENTLKNHLSKPPSSSKRNRSKKNKSRRISWIDDPIHQAEHNSLSRSPFSKQILPERSSTGSASLDPDIASPDNARPQDHSPTAGSSLGQKYALWEGFSLKIDADPRRLLRAMTDSHTRVHVRTKLRAKGLI